MHVRSVLSLAAVLPLAVLAGACGGGSASASTATPADSSTQPVYTPPPTTAPVGPVAPAPAAPLTGSGPATPIAPMAAAAVQPILVGMGQSEAAQGAQPDGSPFAGQFAAGQTLEQTINIKGNGCYTVVAASIGITQLDVALVIQPNPALQPITVAQSAGTGPNATLGGKATGCWHNPTPFAGQGKVILKATGGQGLAAAQVFSK